VDDLSFKLGDHCLVLLPQTLDEQMSLDEPDVRTFGHRRRAGRSG
jgi:hypothetical protein